ncbi:MAG: DUF4276 family protein [Desulfuromonas sp.]|nr:DUF4276 family protein [Desulfuromonas sp.]
MSRVLLLVEGQTERSIIDQVINPYMAIQGIYLYPRIVGKPGHKGGNKFSTVEKEIIALIRQEPSSVITMLFDYYGLTPDWPGLEECANKPLEEIPDIIGNAITHSIAKKLGSTLNPQKFIPYVQLHEIESLLFSGPKEMAEVFQNDGLEEEFNAIVEECGGCENINNSPQTAPSKRIQALYPSYKKGNSVNAHAHRILKKIGVDHIRNCCPKFNLWLMKLENTNLI